MSLNSTTTVVSTITVSNTITILNLLLKNFVNQLPIVFFILGFIGFVGNALTYLHPDLRSNTCCIYSFCCSITDVIYILLNLLPIYLSKEFGTYIPWMRLPNLCKLFMFIAGFFPYLSINFLLLSIIDRFACTCQLTSFIRRINQLKMVPLLISITIIISGLVSLRGIILYQNINSSGCVATQSLTNSILYIIFSGVTQPVAMLIFLLLTYRNVRNSRRRVGGTTTNLHRSRKQFITMISTQVLVTAFISLQWIIMFSYYYIPTSDIKTFEQRTIINFVYWLTNYCYFLNNVKSFYVSIMTSCLFRQTFRKTLISMLPRHMRQRLQVSEANMSIMTVAKINRAPTKQGIKETPC